MSSYLHSSSRLCQKTEPSRSQNHRLWCAIVHLVLIGNRSSMPKVIEGPEGGVTRVTV